MERSRQQAPVIHPNEGRTLDDEKRRRKKHADRGRQEGITTYQAIFCPLIMGILLSSYQPEDRQGGEQKSTEGQLGLVSKLYLASCI